MEVQMVDCLPSVLAGVDDRSIAMRQVLFGRYPPRGIKQVAEKRLVFFRALQLRQRRDVLARHDQQVHRGLGMDVMEGDGHFVFENFLGGNLAARDFAK
jgi:hypothetical protein